MNRKKATRNDWKIHAMPDIRAKLEINRRFSLEEYESLSYGLIPTAMEEKWFIFLEDDWLYFHRSWTGLCIYQVQLVLVEDGYKITEAWVNRHPKQYTSDNDKYDGNFVLGLIKIVLSEFGNLTPATKDVTNTTNCYP